MAVEFLRRAVHVCLIPTCIDGSDTNLVLTSVAIASCSWTGMRKFELSLQVFVEHQFRGSFMARLPTAGLRGSNCNFGIGDNNFKDEDAEQHPPKKKNAITDNNKIKPQPLSIGDKYWCLQFPRMAR